MKSVIGIASVAFLFVITSCSKNHTCECQNPGGTEKIFTAHCKKAKAEKRCSDYYDEKFGDVPMSETHCYIK
jgi:hypothetical protein